jgi:hypothetical protein
MRYGLEILTKAEQEARNKELEEGGATSFETDKIT